jgi:hypothetical protein
MDAEKEKRKQRLRTHYSHALRNVLREIGGVNNSNENREVMKEIDDLLIEITVAGGVRAACGFVTNK